VVPEELHHEFLEKPIVFGCGAEEPGLQKVQVRHRRSSRLRARGVALRRARRRRKGSGKLEESRSPGQSSGRSPRRAWRAPTDTPVPTAAPNATAVSPPTTGRIATTGAATPAAT